MLESPQQTVDVFEAHKEADHKDCGTRFPATRCEVWSQIQTARRQVSSRTATWAL